ncbi:hypothetical protein GCM10010969_20050 [Saccharibacillus kuerlensis]|uniref:Uncharacterized protein n=1 Tax=Saccharibacillus kuerlensis TaxID=459527 RepID=A0ABQ2L1L4_9BACL|nr:hypothetical protein GCM10010969_20050 [Saccharibacillus kuerlensis]
MERDRLRGAVFSCQKAAPRRARLSRGVTPQGQTFEANSGAAASKTGKFPHDLASIQISRF